MSRRLAFHLIMAGAAVIAAAGLAGCSSEPERTVANYCAQVDALTTLETDLASGDPVTIGARADDLRLLLQVAPSAIEPSVVVLLGVTDDFARTAGTATHRGDVADEVFRGRSGDLEAIEAASREVVAYTATNCQIDLDGSGTTRPGSTSSAPPTSDSGSDASTPSSTAPTTTGGPTTTTTSTPSLLVD